MPKIFNKNYLVRKSSLYKMLSKICTVVSDDCLLHETACNTKCIGKLVLIIVITCITQIEPFITPWPKIQNNSSKNGRALAAGSVATRDETEGTINWQTDLFSFPFKQEANEGILNTLKLNFGSRIKM